MSRLNLPLRNSLYIFLKRLTDLTFASIAWLFFSPVLVTIAILVKISSPGPAFYKWKVVGENGLYFTSFKFRSMYQNADEVKAKLMAQNEMTGPVFKLTNDPRITPLGRILRKYSLDELPQLWSVIKGDMSLVGPRPPLQTEYEQFNDWQKRKLAVKPGITCLWQISGRNDIRDFDEWVKLDLQYIEKRSFWLDLKILLYTVKCVMKGTGK
ncbi:MAG: sugar transferase [Deltaproteobacteria bacterium]|nr:sugar transferase [Deltaproteobacteria bacterium]